MSTFDERHAEHEHVGPYCIPERRLPATVGTFLQELERGEWEFTPEEVVRIRAALGVNPLPPQGEPSDAQVLAESDRRWPHTGNGGDLDSSRAVRRLSFRQGAEWMRAALRAAGGEGR